MTSEPLHLVVLFGGQSAEHDVSCITAAHVLAAVDPERYRVTPVGIDREGTWMIADDAAAALAAGPAALPSRLEPTGTLVTPDAVIAPRAGMRTVVLPLLHGPMEIGRAHV